MIVTRVDENRFKIINDDGKAIGAITKTDTGWRVQIAGMDISQQLETGSFGQALNHVREVVSALPPETSKKKKTKNQSPAQGHNQRTIVIVPVSEVIFNVIDADGNVVGSIVKIDKDWNVRLSVSGIVYSDSSRSYEQAVKFAENVLGAN